MKSYFHLIHRTILISALLLVHLYPNKIYSQNQGRPIVNAGFSKINITPEVPLPMSGYAGRKQPFSGVHDELFARVMVFDNGEKRACIIQADLIGFSHKFSDKITLKIEEKTGIPKGNIMLVAVHNHGGPSTGVYSKVELSDLKKYLEKLEEKLIIATETALKNLNSVKTGFGVGTCNMNMNRRARHGDGGIWLGKNPDGPCDHDVAVFRVDDKESNPKGLFINWPCHATVDGQENNLITADWPGATVQFIKENYNQNITISVTDGSSGDIDPIYGPNDNFNHIKAIGAILGEEVIRVTENIKTIAVSDIRVIQKEIILPGKKQSNSRMPNVELMPGEDVSLRLSVMKIGHVVFVGISGELMNEIGVEIKRRSPYKNTIVITHCNGSSGYLCTDKAYEEGGYEPMVSEVMPGTEGLILENVKEMINSL